MIHQDIWLSTQTFMFFFTFLLSVNFLINCILNRLVQEKLSFCETKHPKGANFGNYSFLESIYPTKNESQCERYNCLGQHTNKHYNFGQKSPNIPLFFGVLGTILSKLWYSLLLWSKRWHHCDWLTILVGYIIPQQG